MRMANVEYLVENLASIVRNFHLRLVVLTVWATSLLAALLTGVGALEFSRSLTASASASSGPSAGALYWRAQFDALNTVYLNTSALQGAGHLTFARTDGGTVAWVDARYALPAYLDMHRWDGSTRYLDWFVTQADALLLARRDIDGDGIASWPSAKYSSTVLEDGGFEAQAAAWQGLVSLPHTVKQSLMLADASLAACSSYLPAAKLGKASAVLAPGALLQQAVTADTASREYRLRFDARLPASAGLLVRVSDSSGVQMEFMVEPAATEGSQDWQRWGDDVVLPATGAFTLTFQALPANAEVVYLDNVKLTPYLETYAADMQMAAVLADFALLVQERPQLRAYQAVAERYQHVAEAVMAAYTPYWRELDAQRATLASPSAAQGNLPYNLVAPAGETLLLLGKLREDAVGDLYTQRAVQLANTFRSALRPNGRTPAALSWSYLDALLNTETDFTPRPEDSAHAGNNVPFLVAMHESGLVFSDDDMRRIAAALAGLWNGSSSDPEFFNFLDRRDDLLGEQRFPYTRHVLLGAGTPLVEASATAWRSRQQVVDCVRQANIPSAGWLMSLPAATLRTQYSSTGQTS